MSSGGHGHHDHDRDHDHAADADAPSDAHVDATVTISLSNCAEQVKQNVFQTGTPLARLLRRKVDVYGMPDVLGSNPAAKSAIVPLTQDGLLLLSSHFRCVAFLSLVLRVFDV